jgi:hypothetical protein
MIAFVANFVPLFMINYLICFEEQSIEELIAYTLLQLYILFLLNYG